MKHLRVALSSLLALAGLALVPSAGAANPAAAQARPRPSCHGVPATIVGTDGRDRIVGTRRADVIVGLGGRDTILGGGGDDLICGGGDEDILFGGPGADRVYAGLDPHGPQDQLVGGPGADLLDPSLRSSGEGRVFARVGYAGEPAGVRVQVGSAGRWARVITRTGVDRVRMLPGLTILGSRHDDTYLGSARADRFLGGRGADRFLGGAGKDVFEGDRGDDTAYGGSGADQIDSGDGDDRVAGGAGPDRIRVNEDGGRFHGGPGNDIFEAAASGPEGATLTGGAGSDQLAVFPFYESEETVTITADYRVGLVTTDRSGYELRVSGIETTRFRNRTASGSDPVVIAYFYGTETRDAVWSRVELHAWTYGGQDQLMAVHFDDELDGGADLDSATGGGGDDTCVNIEETTDCD
jgi:Ca2+-binding RTX toxin-like protein